MAGEKGQDGSSAATARPYSPSVLVAFTACVHRIELDRAAAASLVEKPAYRNSALEGLAQRGREHEQAHLDGLRAQGLDIADIPSGDRYDLDALAEAARLTAEAMEQGRAVIYQAAFLQTEDGVAWRGHVDFLRRVETPSVLGAWSYEPWDTKLAREAKASALLQLCAYAEMIERIQNVAPERVHVILGGPGRPKESFSLATIAPYYRQVRKQFLAHMGTGQPAVYPVNDPYPDPVAHCEVCDWSPLCKKRRREDDHLSLVAGITRNQRKALRARGVTTLTALSNLALPLSPPLERTSVVSAARVREQARVQRQGREQGQPVWELIVGADETGQPAIERGMGLSALPAPSSGDLFFDIEGDPFAGENGREYLFGLVSFDGRYEPFWSFDADGERARFEQVVDLIHERLRRHPDLHVYHFAPYETGALKRLAGRLGTRVDEVDELLTREIFVDLYRVLRQGICASVESYSIKKLEVFYGFRREMDLRLAGDARATLELWLEAARSERLANHDEICRQVEDYNREDCVSALRLRDWLEERRRDLEAVLGAAVLRPTVEVKETDEDVAELKIRTLAAKERLTTGVPAEGRTPEQQGRWLLAQLLEWHNREDKSAWWRFFETRELTDQEIIEDPKALGGITYVGEIGSIKRSTIHRYRFTAQEHDLDAGDQCAVREPGYKKGDRSNRKLPTLELLALDDVGCTFDVKVGKGRSAPEIGALIPQTIVRTPKHRARLLELAEHTADHGIATPGAHQLARDLLLRVSPVNGGAGGADASLIREGEVSQAAAVRLVLEMASDSHGASLAIQGPPGSGKTYTGGEMVLALVEKGFKVGVAGPSHEVIRNQLKAVCVAARKRGSAVAIGQKPREDGSGALEDPFVMVIEKTAAVAAGLRDGTVQVAAGTTWMWADPALAAGVDALLVDEAGQMSLANAIVLAHATRNLAFLGDPRQLDQPRKGVHPDGAAVSVLEHLTEGAYTIPKERGVFLSETRRLHPALCRFTSRMFYEGRLTSMPGTEAQVLDVPPPLGGAGIRWYPVPHEGNQSESEEEVRAVKEIVARLVGGGAVALGEVVVLAPYNAQVRALIAALPPGTRVGTVDKFQGQEATVAIYSMTSSTPEDAPRGMGFLYSLNRLNVATSRAKAVAIVVASPALLRPGCKTAEEVRLAAGVCGVAEE